jgi:hypothetical protein
LAIGRAFWAGWLLTAEQRARRLYRFELVLELFDAPSRSEELVRLIAFYPGLAPGVDQCLMLPAIKRPCGDVELRGECFDAFSCEHSRTGFLAESTWIAEPHSHLRRIGAKTLTSMDHF